MKINILLPVSSLMSSLSLKKAIRLSKRELSHIYNIVSTSTYLSLHIYQKTFQSVFLKSSTPLTKG